MATEVQHVIGVPRRRDSSVKSGDRYGGPHEMGPADPPGERGVEKLRQALRCKPGDPLRLRRQTAGGRHNTQGSRTPHCVMNAQRRRGLDENIRQDSLGGGYGENPVEPAVPSNLGRGHQILWPLRAMTRDSDLAKIAEPDGFGLGQRMAESVLIASLSLQREDSTAHQEAPAARRAECRTDESTSA
jgi:hypothetical protein